MTPRTAIRSALALVAALLISATANAQLFRAYLAPSPAGNDANPCTLPAPCRLLPAALAAVADGGEIWMLDSANYNTATVNITKSVSILAIPGAVGSVVAVGGPAISITAPGLRVALRNLVIVPLPASGAVNGINVTGTSSLTIEESLIANLPYSGIYAVGTGTVRIANTIIRNNGQYAVWAQNGMTVSIAGTKMLGNDMGGVLANGLAASTTTTAIVSDSVIVGGSEGIFAYAAVAGAVAKVFVTRCTVEGTFYGLDSETGGAGSALVSVGASMITNNNSAWYQSGTGSVIESSGNNQMRGNVGSTGVLTPAGLQ
jgi:hypothetical protein